MWVDFFEIGVNGDLKSENCHKCALESRWIRTKCSQRCGFCLYFVNLFVVKSRESYLNSSTFIP